MAKKRIIKVAVGQISPTLGDLDKNIAKHCSSIEKAIAQKVDLILFPELSLTGYSLKDATFDVALEAQSKLFKELLKLSTQISISFGFVELGERHELYNSNLFLEDGKIQAHHRKVYLPTYGVFEEDRYFSSGSRFKSFDSKLTKFGTLICEDIWHTSSGLILALDGATVILVSAAGLTRGTSKNDKPENIVAWETLIKSMAITTTSYVIFANRVGVEDGLVFWGGSEVVQPNGHSIAKAGYYNEELLLAEIDMYKLKHARLNATILSDEKLPVLIDEFTRLHKKNSQY